MSSCVDHKEYWNSDNEQNFVETININHRLWTLIRILWKYAILPLCYILVMMKISRWKFSSYFYQVFTREKLLIFQIFLLRVNLVFLVKFFCLLEILLSDESEGSSVSLVILVLLVLQFVLFFKLLWYFLLFDLFVLIRLFSGRGNFDLILF